MFHSRSLWEHRDRQKYPRIVFPTPSFLSPHLTAHLDFNGEALVVCPPRNLPHAMNSEWSSQPHSHAATYTPSDSTDGAAFASPLGGAGSWANDGFSHDPGFLASQEELRCMLFTIAQSAAPTRAASPIDQGHDSGDASQAGERMRPALSNARRVKYLKNYVGQVAPWLDMFDSQGTFRVQIPALARTFPALLNAVLAISARQMERKEGARDSFDSLELYQEAIRLLSPLLLQMRDPKVVAACVLLCCLEMMSARAQDWRRHLEGCTALFEAFEIHGFSGGILQAVFWCYVRMDVCGALISDGIESTLLRPSKWLAPGCHEEDAAQLFQAAKSPDMHANYAVYLCAVTCELVSDRTQFLELGAQNDCNGAAFHRRWLRLWEDLQNWVDTRPSELLPVQTTSTKPFPHILFLHWAAISSNQLYHTACILLLNTMPKGMKIHAPLVASALWHARQVCGISLANPHHGCLNNAIQPLWIAGRLFSHHSEHAIIVDIFRRIEAETGWGACWRIRDLELAWGYQVSHNSRKGGRRELSLAG